MKLSGLTGGLYRMSEWIMKFAYVNLLWLLFSCVGLLVFGIMPSTAALFAVVRKWIMGQHDIPVFKMFWETYKKCFIKINIIGIILYIIGIILYIDFLHFTSHSGLFFIIFLVLSIIYCIMLLYIFPIFSHFELSIGQYFTYSLVLGISNILSTIMMICCLLVYFFILRLVPGILPFFSGSVVSFIVMWIAYQAFKKLEKRKNTTAVEK